MFSKKNFQFSANSVTTIFRVIDARPVKSTFPLGKTKIFNDFVYDEKRFLQKSQFLKVFFSQYRPVDFKISLLICFSNYFPLNYEFFEFEFFIENLLFPWGKQRVFMPMNKQIYHRSSGRFISAGNFFGASYFFRRFLESSGFWLAKCAERFFSFKIEWGQGAASCEIRVGKRICGAPHTKYYY